MLVTVVDANWYFQPQEKYADEKNYCQQFFDKVLRLWCSRRACQGVENCICMLILLYCICNKLILCEYAVGTLNWVARSHQSPSVTLT